MLSILATRLMHGPSTLGGRETVYVKLRAYTGFTLKFHGLVRTSLSARRLS